MVRYKADTYALHGQRVRDHYNTVGQDYEQRVARRWKGGEAARWAIATIPSPIETALDLGAGTGISTEAILDVANPQRLVAVDFSEVMLSQLRKNHPDDRIRTVVMEAKQYLTTTEDRFDLVVMMGVLHYFTNPGGLLQRVAGVTRSGGYLVFSYDRWVPDSLIQGSFSSSQTLPFYRIEPEHVEQNLFNAGLLVVRHTHFTTPPDPAFPPYTSGLIIAQKPMPHRPFTQETIYDTPPSISTVPLK